MAAIASDRPMKVGFVPGTGRMGKLIASHLAKSDGVEVFLGSRDPAKAVAAASSISSSNSKHRIQAGSNAEAAAWASVIFWSPTGSLEEREALLKSLASHLENKIIIDVTNVGYLLDETQLGQTSSTLLNQKALGVPARWTTAFKSTFWKLLEELPDPANPHHTFVAGDDEEAVAATIALVELIPGFKAVRAGGLVYSKIVELLGPRWIVELDKLNAGGRFRSGWRFGV